MSTNFDEIFWDEERDGPLKAKRGRRSNKTPNNQLSPDFILWELENGFTTKEQANDQFMNYLRETWLD
jgi:hypothetical protein